MLGFGFWNRCRCTRFVLAKLKYRITELDFVYGNYHIPWHEADVVNSEFDCLSNEMCAEIGQCDACKGHGALGYCCNVLGIGNLLARDDGIFV